LQAFVAYLKSVMMASNKKIFNVTQIDLDDFARLVTLLLQLLYTVCIVTLYNIISLCTTAVCTGLALLVDCREKFPLGKKSWSISLQIFTHGELYGTGPKL